MSTNIHAQSNATIARAVENNTKEITITWKAFSADTDYPVTSLTFSYAFFLDDERICDLLFQDTNLYQGAIWEHFIEPNLPANRSHTALSVDDEITISDSAGTRTYLCSDFGWELLQETKGGK